MCSFIRFRRVHIRDLKIRALPDETLKQAVLEASCQTWGEGSAVFTLSYKGELCLEDTKDLTGEDTFTWEILKPHLWERRRSRSL